MQVVADADMGLLGSSPLQPGTLLSPPAVLRLLDQHLSSRQQGQQQWAVPGQPDAGADPGMAFKQPSEQAWAMPSQPDGIAGHDIGRRCAPAGGARMSGGVRELLQQNFAGSWLSDGEQLLRQASEVYLQQQLAAGPLQQLDLLPMPAWPQHAVAQPGGPTPQCEAPLQADLLARLYAARQAAALEAAASEAAQGQQYAARQAAVQEAARQELASGHGLEAAAMQATQSHGLEVAALDAAGCHGLEMPGMASAALSAGLQATELLPADALPQTAAQLAGLMDEPQNLVDLQTAAKEASVSTSSSQQAALQAFGRTPDSAQRQMPALEVAQLNLGSSCPDSTGRSLSIVQLAQQLMTSPQVGPVARFLVGQHPSRTSFRSLKSFGHDVLGRCIVQQLTCVFQIGRPVCGYLQGSSSKAAAGSCSYAE